MEFGHPWNSGGIFSSEYGSFSSKHSCSPESEHTSDYLFEYSSVSLPSYSLISISESFILFSGYISPETFSLSGGISSSSPETISFDELRKYNYVSFSSCALFGYSLVHSLSVLMFLRLVRINDRVR